jgi:hypothetical protein
MNFILNLNSDYVIHDLLKHNDPSINQSILDFGILLYNYKINIIHDDLFNTDFNNIIADLKAQHKKELDSIILSNNIIINDLNLKFDKAKNDFIQFKNDNLRDNLDLINLGYNNAKNDLNDILEIKNSRINELSLELQQIKNGEHLKIQNQIQFLTDNIFKGNSQKGVFGENIIFNFIADKFSHGSLFDVSNKEAHGDFHYFNNNFKLLIESKNVLATKKDFIDKFYRDIDFCSSNLGINAALYISLNDTSLIDNKKRFVFIIKNNIPIIFLGNTINNLEYIRFSILVLEYIINNDLLIKNFHLHDNDFFYLFNLFHKFKSIFDNSFKYLHNDILIKQLLLDNISNREKDSKIINDLFVDLFANFPAFANFNSSSSIPSSTPPSSIPSTPSSIHDIILILKSNNVLKKNISKKLLLNLNIPSSLIEHLGGIASNKQQLTDNESIHIPL